MQSDPRFKPYLLAEVANKYNMSLESIDLVQPTRTYHTSGLKIIPASQLEAKNEIMNHVVGADSFSGIPPKCINQTQFILSPVGKGKYYIKIRSRNNLIGIY